MGYKPMLVFSVLRVLWYMATPGVLRSTTGFLMCSSIQMIEEEVEDREDVEDKEEVEEMDAKG